MNLYKKTNQTGQHLHIFSELSKKRQLEIPFSNCLFAYHVLTVITTAGICHSPIVIVVPGVSTEPFCHLIKMPICFPKKIIMSDAILFLKWNKSKLTVCPVFLNLTFCHKCHTGFRCHYPRHMAMKTFYCYIWHESVFFAKLIGNRPVFISLRQTDKFFIF